MTPKQRFQQKAENLAFHRDLVHAGPFLYAVDVAILQYQHKLSLDTAGDLQSSSAGFHRLMGAIAFVEEFVNLSAATELTKKAPDRSNLNPNV